MSEVVKIEGDQEPRAVAPITPMQMLQIAVEKGADLDQLQKLMDLQDRWEQNEARKAFVAAKAAFKAEPVQIVKNKTVGYQGRNGASGTQYDHATLDAVAAALSPALGKHGLSYSWETEQPDGSVIRVTCVLTHEMGHSERVSLQAGADMSGSKNNIQAIGSTVTYLQRYTLLAVTGMATKEQDDDGHKADHEPITDEQKAKIIAKMKDVEADTVAFLKFLAVPTLDDLPAKEFDRAMKALEAKRKKKDAE